MSNNQVTLNRFFKSKFADKKVLSVDIDGTIADISERIAIADAKFKKGTGQYYDCLLSSDRYHLDRPLPTSVRSLNEWSLTGGCIVYLSGRRAGTEKQTSEWLEVHGFPQGRVVHRERGTDSRRFKSKHLREMTDTYAKVVAHIGDRIDDDGGAAKDANVRFIHIPANNDEAWKQWNQWSLLETALDL